MNFNKNNITVTWFKVLFFLMVLGMFFISCRKPTTEQEVNVEFVDENLINRGWHLFQITTASDSMIIEKPETSFDNPSSFIFLAFTSDYKVVGHAMSIGFDGGDYIVQEDGTFQITSLAFPELPTCCEWDEYFLLNQLFIHSYEINNSRLILYFGSDNNKMIFR